MPSIFRLSALLWLLLASVWWGCQAATLQQARTAEQQKREKEALALYQMVAERSTDPDAAKARAERIRLLTRQEAWTTLLSETAALVNFLDKEDTWFQQFRNQPAVWESSERAIEGALVLCGRQAHQKAGLQGDPMAFAAVVRCFGLYLDHFSRGPHRQEAALRRGESLAVREGCLPALPWLRRAISPPPDPTPQIPPPISPHPPASTAEIVYHARLNLLRCEMRLWQRHREDPQHARWRDPAFQKQPFSTILASAVPLLQQKPQATARALIQQADLLQRKQALGQSLRTLLMVIQTLPNTPETQLAQMQALQIFGQTDNWAPLLAAIPTPTPAQAKELFWQRVKTLVLIHGMRTAQALLQRGQTFQAVEQFLNVHKLTAGHPEANNALYQAALALESRNALPNARALYKRIYTESPDDRLALMAWYRYASLLKKERKFLEAGRSFERLAHLNPMHMITPRAYFNAYEAYQEQGLADEAKRIRRILQRQYPLSMEAKQFKKQR